MARRIAGLSGHTADKKGEEKDRPLGLPWIVRLDHQELPGPGICGDSMGGVATFVEVALKTGLAMVLIFFAGSG
ncbi:hypothetical protein JTE90_019548 [Oedothorax gibbosus]|uniref:Uncharacterized protein n=1 Tax=Oedothorax gibbosus TaxID=931172 RepID=A0AAV6U6T4_9ARAC|nr:hypothetical protein JTE90_019548 [Oedothorax gibbosus]